MSIISTHEKIPKNWRVLPISDVCNIRKTNKINSELYVGLEHIEKGTNTLIKKTNKNDFSSTTNIFKKGDILYGKLRPNLNKVWLATEDGYCSTDLLPLMPNQKILKEFLLYNVSSSKFVSFAISTSSGTKMPRTNWNDIKNFQILIPPLQEQTKITSRLSNIDSLIQRTHNVIKQTQKLKKGLMQKLLLKGLGHKKFKKVNWLYGKELEIPVEYNIRKVEHLIKNKNDLKTGPFGSTLKKDTFVSKGYKVYGQENVIPDDFSVGNYFITKEHFEKMKEYELKLDDVLISLVGTHGKISIVPENIQPGIINPRLLRIRFDKSKAIPQFMKILLESNIVKSQIKKLVHGLTMEIMNTAILRKILFPIPPVVEQQKIAVILSNMNLLIEKERKFKSQLKNIKKGLLIKLLTGKIRVN